MTKSIADGAAPDEELVERILEAQAEERERIARELHDETGQSLTALLVGLRALEEGASEVGTKQRAAELRNSVRSLIENVARLAKGLHPTPLGELELAEVIRQQVTDFAKLSGVQTDVEIHRPELLERLSRPAQLAVYRVVQESLTNVWRHAGANNARVVVGPRRRAELGVDIAVSDDGNGLAHRPSASRGLGLVLMRRRLESLGGSLEVDATEGVGTTIHARLPLHPEDSP